MFVADASAARSDVGEDGDIVLWCSVRTLRLGLFSLVLATAGSIASAESEPVTWDLQVCADQDNLPYSNNEEQGFENKIMALVASTIKAKLSYVWLPRVRNSSQDVLLLRNGTCDVFLDVGNGHAPYFPTLEYYQSTYEFIYRADAPYIITSLDDPVLHTLKLGAVATSPAGFALALRGLVPNTKHFFPTPPTGVTEAMVDDVADGAIDLAVVWGPEAAYFASRQSIELRLTPVVPQIDASGLSMVFTTAMGVRSGDIELRDLLNEGIASQWDAIQDVLHEFDVPILPLPKPAISIIGGGE